MMSIIVRKLLIPTVIAEDAPIPQCFVKLPNLVIVMILKYLTITVSEKMHSMSLISSDRDLKSPLSQI